MKSILIVTEQFTVGGLETHIRGEVSQLIKKGIQVHLATGKNFNAELLPSGLSSLNHNIPLDPTATADELLIAINRLRQIIHEQLIDCIHVHPFTSIIPAVAAAELEAIPVAITLHGPASLISYGPLYDFLLKNIILPNSELIITVSPEMKRLASAYTDERFLNYIPNAVSFTSPKELNIGSDEMNPHWVIVSRLDQFKIHGITDFCAKAKVVGIPSLLVVGDGPAKEEFRQELEQRGLSNYVNLYGPSNQVQLLMKQSAGVAGMGRVVLEGIACQKPVVLVGYDGVKGVVDKALLELSADSNFSGRGLPVINAEDFLEQLKKNSDLDFSHLYDFAKNLLNEATVWSEFYDSMKAARPVKPTSISGLYLSLSGNPISGLIPYLHSIELLDRLGTVICGKKYYEPRLSAAVLFCRQRIESTNFNQILAERDTQITTLNQTVTEQDAHIATLNQAVAERDAQITSLNRIIGDKNSQIQHLNDAVKSHCNQVTDLLESHSWKITRPMRVIARAIKSRGLNHSDRSKFYNFVRHAYHRILASYETRIYQLLKTIYWKLPQWLRIRLDGYRYHYVARHFSASAATTCAELKKISFGDQSANHIKTSQQIAIIPCAFEFDELVNQRPINAAKYYAQNGFLVLFIVWQWSSSEQLQKGYGEVATNILQIPMYEFFANTGNTDYSGKVVHYLITFPSRAFIDIIDPLRQQAVVIYYDIMDEWEEFHRVGQAPWYEKALEENLILKADIVTAVSPVLAQKFSSLRTDIHIIGNGFTPAVLGQQSRSIAQRRRFTENPVIGYFGHLTDAWFDWGLLFDLATDFPSASFEIIGYGQPDWVSNKVLAYRNIRLWGKVPPAQLHKHVANWSIGIIPFSHSALSEAVDPIKIYEYLYFGLPVVVTGISHLSKFPRTFYTTRESIIATIRQALADETPQTVVDMFLEHSTWQARFSAMADLSRKVKGFWSLYEH